MPDRPPEPPSTGDDSPLDFDPTRSMELVWKGQKGDAEAVNELLGRYAARMLRVIRIKIPQSMRRLIEPEDVLQETLLVASRKLGELEIRTPSSILSWMARIAELQIKSQLEYHSAQKRDPRREQPLGKDSSDSTDGAGVIVPHRGPTASQYLAHNELEARVDSEIQALEPPEYREVLVMRDYLEADWETIQQHFGRPNERAARELYERARRRLRERLARYL
jgi:DNA-directed RNA polymerase specialized sigma24 family protein